MLKLQLPPPQEPLLLPAPRGSACPGPSSAGAGGLPGDPGGDGPFPPQGSRLGRISSAGTLSCCPPWWGCFSSERAQRLQPASRAVSTGAGGTATNCRVWAQPRCPSLSTAGLWGAGCQGSCACSHGETAGLCIQTQAAKQGSSCLSSRADQRRSQRVPPAAESSISPAAPQ